MILACGGIKKKPEPVQQEKDSKPTTDAPVAAKPAPTPEAVWSAPDKWVQQGDVSVHIEWSYIGKVQLEEIVPMDGAGSKDEHFAVKLSLTNINPTKKVEYHSWGGAEIPTDGDFAALKESVAMHKNAATLKDNFGNNYKRVNFGLVTKPVGAVSGNESIYPNKTITDVLVFEKPLDTVTNLDLELPAKHYGNEGVVRFRIPITTLSRAAQ
ncbi:hypothetical protein FRUB_00339 [Fimbriiglobus ruber]|uniref:Uncharacterized protein n=2 Tax=Fimbriiglobus ruber TaxID=1908690 RepID=A0A225DYM2_9BACT|nr:hypothetical protein FRUB_00339 [Fimbriiglobus ruber]